MPVFTDQTGRIISLSQHPQRIVSLVPSQTELLSSLGLNDEVIGITKFCIHPEFWFHSKTRVGGTKQLNMDTIRDLQPDLIIANKEENLKDQIEELEKQFPVWISDISTYQQAMEMIHGIGLITGKEKPAQELISKIENEFAALPHRVRMYRTAYLIWKNPYMAAGGDTFISEMMQRAGFENLLIKENRYPEITIEYLRKKNCEVLLLSSEPFPFKQKQADELQLLLPGTKIVLADGEMFSWYGSRMLKAPQYFIELRKMMNNN